MFLRPIKGCATEDYSDVLGAAGYIEEESLLPGVSYMPPMCDLDYYSISMTIPPDVVLTFSYIRGVSIVRFYWFGSKKNSGQMVVSPKTMFLRQAIIANVTAAALPLPHVGKPLKSTW